MKIFFQKIIQIGLYSAFQIKKTKAVNEVNVTLKSYSNTKLFVQEKEGKK